MDPEKPREVKPVLTVTTNPYNRLIGNVVSKSTSRNVVGSQGTKSKQQTSRDIRRKGIYDLRQHRSRRSQPSESTSTQNPPQENDIPAGNESRTRERRRF